MGKKKKSGRYDFSSTGLLIFIWQNKLPLAGITLAAVIVSVIVSLSITPLYRSTVVLFPAPGTSVSKSLLTEGYSGSPGIYELGEEEDAEKLIQVLNSNTIRDRIIEKYDLAGHYKMKPDQKYIKSKLNKRYRSNVKFKRTPYRSVIIQVLDKDPEISAAIANDISVLADTVFHRMLRERAIEALFIIEKEYTNLKESLAKLEDSLSVYRNLGINDYESQAERYHEAYAKAILEGNMNAARILESKLNILSRYGTQYTSLRTQIALESTRLFQIKRKYSEAKIESEQTIPWKFVVNTAEIPDKKAYPKRMIIVLVSAFSAFLFGLIFLIISDNIRNKIL